MLNISWIFFLFFYHGRFQVISEGYQKIIIERGIFEVDQTSNALEVKLYLPVWQFRSLINVSGSPPLHIS